MDTSSQFYKALSSISFYKPQLYNDSATIIWEINPQKKKRGSDILITIAKPLDPNKKGRPQKGEAKFDYKNSAKFILSPIECYQILTNMPKIMKGIYENPKETNPKFKKIFQIVHFRKKEEGEGTPSRLLLQLMQDDKGNTLPLVKMTIVPPKEWNNTQTASYVFKPDELKYFLNFLEAYFKYSGLILALLEWTRSNILYGNGETNQDNTATKASKTTKDGDDDDYSNDTDGVVSDDFSVDITDFDPF